MKPRVFRRQFIRPRIVPTALYISCSLISQLSLSGQQDAKLPHWNSKEALTSELDAAHTIDKFTIRPPKGYLPETRLGPHGSKATAWAGSPRSDGTRPQVMVLTAKLPAEELQKYNLEQALDELVSSLRAHRTNWTQTTTEKGLINGLTFVRTRWKGVHPSNGFKMSGFVYVAIVGDTLIQLSSQDVEPHQEEALKLAESSVLTFERNNGKG